ncbi:50S ribosomal protein L3 [Marinithermus hydrothermalis]|uniref:Large ribosomal subunit protein uL3 n=1 Tax=Marinithermus hydrothermalis (strain DSM 14884 / JCM 11576 / T1) TaxID=869210 RepID=F2NMS7_MARHT|nr:50S ribosomal protein L3 [Marinithermus hydrothermalis]AEB12461.1 50S ribosomal protein L3 [Marinithermus hydrothermalis DSM 14884]
MKGILGAKIGMTQIWKDDRAIPVTVILAGPCPVVQRRTVEKDGYEAVQLGFLPQKPQRVNKPMKGHFEKAGVEPVRYLREIRGFNPEGDVVTVSIFQPGERVDVTGISKGRGFTGVMKRWGFAGGPDSHGAHRIHRHPGSIGQRKTPGRVYKGKKMAGRYGAERVTVQNLEVVDVIAEENLILVKGAVPGPNGGLVILRESVKGAK